MLKRYPHNLPHTVSGTINMGLCYPASIWEVFPADSFKVSISDLTRFMPQVSPTMADVNVGVDIYQVPLRQLFDKIGLDWDAFLTGGEDGDDDTVEPTITIPEGGYEPGGLADWLNYPCNYTDPQDGTHYIVGAGKSYSALPVIAYMHIINENYRDQNFIAKLDLTKYQEFLDGDYAFETPAGDAITYDLLVQGIFRKAWRRDYFGRALPNTQRGNPVQVPVLGGTAPIIYGAKTTTASETSDAPIVNGQVVSQSNGSSNALSNLTTGGAYDAYPLLADLTTKGTTYFDLITFRLAARMQRFGEILNRSGARAVEFTFAMFGVKIPDDRIQRPIFHGSFKLPVIFSEVLQTSSTDSTSPQGNLAGHGITGGTNQPIHIKCIEHGFVIAIMHVMPLPQYHTVVPKYLLRKTRWDLPNPLFQHIGDQEILTEELYPNATAGKKFGYGTRYAELSYIPSTVHGLMKSQMMHWTMCRTFESEPELSAAFRYAEPSMRSFAVQYLDANHTIRAPQMQCTLGFDIKSRRPFMKNPQPGIHIV